MLPAEIDQVKDFPPEEWNFDFPEFLSFYYGQSYFYPLVAVLHKKLVGVGYGIVNGIIGWPGNIIVLSEFRRQGIGATLTKTLSELLTEMGCSTQLLIATESGKRVYEKLGFRISSYYSFFKGNHIPTASESRHIRRIQAGDLPRILELDREISGEERSHLIERWHSTGWLHRTPSSPKVNGFYLPDFGGGPIIARDNKAGVELLHFKHARLKTTAVIPIENISAKDFLKTRGFTEYAKAPRMVLGTETSWKPALIFSRAEGYCG